MSPDPAPEAAPTPSPWDEKIGREVGVSSWITVDQARIDAFADCTLDRYFLHTDPARAAAEGPFGGAIAHGFLTLSLLSVMAFELDLVGGRGMLLNYGFDKVRFLAPVPAGARVRGRFTLISAAPRASGQTLVRFGVTVEIEGRDKPALAADWSTLHFSD